MAVPEITDEEIAAARRRSPMEARNLENARERMRAAMAAYRSAFTGLRQDLARVGYQVESVGGLLDDFGATGTPYKSAIPVLVTWLPMTTYEPLVHDIVRTLSVPWAKPEASTPLVMLFRSVSNEGIRWAVGNALEQIDDHTIVSDLVALASDPRYGNARDPVVRAIAKTKNRDVIPALIGLLDDPEIVYSALAALGKLTATEAREPIERLLHHPDKLIRKDAEKALKRLR